MKLLKKMLTTTALLGIIAPAILGWAAPSLAYPIDSDTGEAIPNICYQYVHIKNTQNFRTLILASKRPGANYVRRIHRLDQQHEDPKIIELSSNNGPAPENRMVALVYEIDRDAWGRGTKYSTKEYIVAACANGRHITLETAGTPDNPTLIKKEQSPPQR